MKREMAVSELAYSVLFYGSALAFGICLGVWLLP